MLIISTIHNMSTITTFHVVTVCIPNHFNLTCILIHFSSPLANRKKNINFLNYFSFLNYLITTFLSIFTYIHIDKNVEKY